MPTLSSFIFAARSDASFIAHTLPGLLQMLKKVDSKPVVTVDTSSPGGVLGESLSQADLSQLAMELESIQTLEHPFHIEKFSPNLTKVINLSVQHFGYPHRETHCFRGYPTHGSIRQFHQKDSDYILHLDCDMLFYEDAGFSWIEKGIRLMEENEDILCILPRGGPPTNDGELHQGTTYYEKDESRGLYLFKNFTSRHYLMHKKRFLSLLPMKPEWLSWREPIKSRFFGNGKMLCWETTVEKSLEKSSLWRADLMTEKAWSLHPGERNDDFYRLLPQIVKYISKGIFPEKQAGHFDVRLNDWEAFINRLTGTH